MLPHVIDGKSVECKSCVSRADARDSGMVPNSRFSGHGFRGADRSFQSGGAAFTHGNDGAASAGFGGGAQFGGTPFGGVPVGGRPVENKVFVGGLAPVTTTESMNAYFSQFGAADCIVMMDRQTGRSRGFGFCTFESAEQVQLALTSGSNANGKTAEHVIDGKLVCARICEDRAERGFQPRPSASAMSPLFGGVDGSSGHVGAVDTNPANSLNTALASLQQAIGSLTGAMGGAQAPQAQTNPNPFVSHGTAGQGLASSRIFVGGLPQTCDDAKLHMFFSQFGTLTDAKVMMDKGTNRSRGFGYVSFADAQACEVVLTSGRQSIDDKWIEIKRCEERGSPVLQGRGPALPPHMMAAPAPGHAGFAGPAGLASGGGDALSAALSLLQAPQLTQLQEPQSVGPALIETGAFAHQLTGMLQGSLQPAAGAGAGDILGQVTQMLQDPQVLLQAILTPVVSQLTGAAGQPAPSPAFPQPDHSGNNNSNRYMPY